MFRVPRWLGCISFVVLLAAGAGRPAWAGDGKVGRAPGTGAPATAAKDSRAPAVPAAPATSTVAAAPAVSAAAPAPVVAAAPSAPAARPLPAVVVRGHSPAVAAGLILALDPVTGDRVRPTPGQFQDLGSGLEALWDFTGESIEVSLPDGSRGSYVGRRFAKALIAHIGPSGKVSWGCGPMSQTPIGPPIAPEE